VNAPDEKVYASVYGGGKRIEKNLEPKPLSWGKARLSAFTATGLGVREIDPHGWRGSSGSPSTFQGGYGPSAFKNRSISGARNLGGY